MSLRKLPSAKLPAQPQNYQWDIPTDFAAQWLETPLAAEADDPDTITIFDVIGEDFWTGGGFTAKRMAAALRSIGAKPVTVKVNSPGGSMFEGIAIYNLLREHPAKVTVDVMGWAASAASIIAMAADEIRMGLGTFVMIHKAWGMAVGNQDDFTEAAQLFGTFDSAIADIYEARTGQKRDDILAMMKAETFLGPTEAIEKGFADTVDEGLSASEASASANDNPIQARRSIEAGLAKSGHSRQQRAEMIQNLLNSSVAPRDASHPAERDAGVNVVALKRLIETIKT